MVDLRGKDVTQIYDAILKERGVTDDFFDYNENNLVSIPNMDKAVQVIPKYKDKSVCILGDVDTDGCTSCAIMYRFLKEDLGFTNVWWSINRGKAHGLRGQDLSRFDDAELLIIVDSLDENAEQYSRLNIPIIIFDHHVPKLNDYGDNVTLVSSHYSKNPDLSGAGVVWKFVYAYDKEYNTKYSEWYFDLAATGIVADMCDMRSPENRYICYHGFKNLQNLGLKSILRGYEFNATSISFSIATLINAAVRTFNNSKAVEVLLDNDSKSVANIVDDLKYYKIEQNNEVNRVIPLSNIVEQNIVTVILPNDMKYDITGLIANKISAEKQKPAIVLRDDGNAWRGSMRGYATKNFAELLESTRYFVCQG